MENYLYFAEEDVETGANAVSEAITVPASSYLFADPESAILTNFYFKSVLGSDYGMQKVALAHTSGKNKEVIKGVLACVNAGPKSGGFVIVANANVAALTTGVEFSEALEGFVTGVAITEDSSGSIGGIKNGVRNYHLPEMHWGAASSPLQNGFSMLANNNFHSIATTATATLPPAADGKIGDWITVKYSTVINDGVAHTFNLAGVDATFIQGSTITRIGGGVASGIDVCDGSAKNTVLITGADDGDGGIGTIIRFLNTTGKADGWAVEAIVLNQGDGSVAMDSDTKFPA